MFGKRGWKFTPHLVPRPSGTIATPDLNPASPQVRLCVPPYSHREDLQVLSFLQTKANGGEQRNWEKNSWPLKIELADRDPQDSCQPPPALQKQLIHFCFFWDISRSLGSLGCWSYAPLEKHSHSKLWSQTVKMEQWIGSSQEREVEGGKRLKRKF